MKKKIDWYHAIFAFLIHTIFAQVLGSMIILAIYMSGDSRAEMSIMDFQFTKTGIIVASSFQFIFFMLVPVTYLKLIKRDIKDLITIKKGTIELTIWAVLGTLAVATLIEGILYELSKYFPYLNKGLLPGMDGQLNFHELIAQAIQSDHVIIMLGMVLVIGILPGLGEEFFYRGFMQNILIKRFNFFISVLLSGGIFASMHAFQQINQAISAFVISFFFGYMLYKTGNLFFPIIGHMINNSLFVIILFFNKDALNAMQEGYPIYILILSAIVLYFSVNKFTNTHLLKAEL
jgi:membrane protease YdiL (CAAX protease family)